MSYKNPIIPGTTLKGIDAKIALINAKMSFTWLEKVFGIADRMVDKDERVFPGVFEGDRVDPIDLSPSDLYSAFCFWVKGDADVENEIGIISPVVSYPVGCIFYVDLKQVGVSYKSTMTKIREDIHNFFNTLYFPGQLAYIGTTEENLADIYEGFTVDEIDNIYKEYPKWAYRVNFDLSFRDDCYTTNF